MQSRMYKDNVGIRMATINAQSGFTKNDEFTMKLRICFKEIFQEVIFQIAKDLYDHHHLVKSNKVKSIHELCKKVSVGNKDLKNAVGGKFFPKDFSWDIDKELDVIHCIYLVINVVSEQHEPDIRKSDSGKDLIESLECIIKFRNKMDHEEGMSLKDLEERKLSLLTHLSTICKCMASLKIFKDTKIKEKYEKICDYSTTNINFIWLSSITNESQLKQLMKNKDENYKKFILSYCMNLNNIYEGYKSDHFLKEHFSYKGELFATPLLTLVNQNSASYQISLAECIKLKNGCSVAVLVGDTGHGKSTICKKLVQDWCKSPENIHTMLDHNFLLVIDVKRATKSSLIKYLKEILFQDRKESDDDIYLFLMHLKLLFIIDDYDEKSDGAENIIDSLFNIFSDKKFILTTKPPYATNIFEHLGKANLSYNEIHIEGLESKTELFNKISPHLNWKVDMSNITAKIFETYCEKLPADTRSFLSVPAVYLLLIYLLNQGISKEKFQNLTISRIYLQFFASKERFIKIFGCSLEILLRKIGEQCFEHFRKSKNIVISMIAKCINVEKFQDKQNCINFDPLLCTIFKLSPNIGTFSNGTGQYQFEFLHKTQIEFFAANYAAYCVLKGNSLMDTFQDGHLKDNSNVFLILLEILNEKGKIDLYVNEITNILKDNFLNDYNILWKILIKMSKHNKMNLQPNMKLCHYYKRKLQHNWQLNDDSVLSALNILCYVDFDSMDVEIEIKKNNFPVSLFKQNLDKLEEKKKRLRNINLTLDIDKDIDSTICESILKCLNPEGMKLTSFTGHINQDSCKSLEMFDNIVNISCRITSLDDLNTFNELLDKKKWKEIDLHFDEPFKTKEESIPTLKCHGDENMIFIEFIKSKDLNLTIYNLKMLKPVNCKFSIVKLRIDNYPKSENKHMKKHLNSLKHLIENKLVVVSRHDISSEELLSWKLKLDGIEVDWN